MKTLLAILVTVFCSNIFAYTPDPIAPVYPNSGSVVVNGVTYSYKLNVFDPDESSEIIPGFYVSRNRSFFIEFTTKSSGGPVTMDDHDLLKQQMEQLYADFMQEELGEVKTKVKDIVEVRQSPVEVIDDANNPIYFKPGKMRFNIYVYARGLACSNRPCN